MNFKNMVEEFKRYMQKSQSSFVQSKQNPFSQNSFACFVEDFKFTCLTYWNDAWQQGDKNLPLIIPIYVEFSVKHSETLNEGAQSNVQGDSFESGIYDYLQKYFKEEKVMILHNFKYKVPIHGQADFILYDCNKKIFCVIEAKSCNAKSYKEKREECEQQLVKDLTFMNVLLKSIDNNDECICQNVTLIALTDFKPDQRTYHWSLQLEEELNNWRRKADFEGETTENLAKYLLGYHVLVRKSANKKCINAPIRDCENLVRTIVNSGQPDIDSTYKEFLQKKYEISTRKEQEENKKRTKKNTKRTREENGKCLSSSQTKFLCKFPFNFHETHQKNYEKPLLLRGHAGTGKTMMMATVAHGLLKAGQEIKFVVCSSMKNKVASLLGKEHVCTASEIMETMLKNDPSEFLNKLLNDNNFWKQVGFPLFDTSVPNRNDGDCQLREWMLKMKDNVDLQKSLKKISEFLSEYHVFIDDCFMHCIHTNPPYSLYYAFVLTFTFVQREKLKFFCMAYDPFQFKSSESDETTANFQAAKECSIPSFLYWVDKYTQYSCGKNVFNVRTLQSIMRNSQAIALRWISELTRGNFQKKKDTKLGYREPGIKPFFLYFKKSDFVEEIFRYLRRYPFKYPDQSDYNLDSKKEDPQVAILFHDEDLLKEFNEKRRTVRNFEDIAFVEIKDIEFPVETSGEKKRPASAVGNAPVHYAAVGKVDDSVGLEWKMVIVVGNNKFMTTFTDKHYLAETRCIAWLVLCHVLPDTVDQKKWTYELNVKLREMKSFQMKNLIIEMKSLPESQTQFTFTSPTDTQLHVRFVPNNSNAPYTIIRDLFRSKESTFQYDTKFDELTLLVDRYDIEALDSKKNNSSDAIDAYLEDLEFQGNMSPDATDATVTVPKDSYVYFQGETLGTITIHTFPDKWLHLTLFKHASCSRLCLITTSGRRLYFNVLHPFEKGLLLAPKSMFDEKTPPTVILDKYVYPNE